MMELNEDATIDNLHKILMSIIDNKEPFAISHQGKFINFDKNKHSTLDSFGITDLSTIQIINRIQGGGWYGLDIAKMLPVKEFFEKFEEYKPEKEDESKSIKYYKAQSCNFSLKDKPLEILYEIDEDLEDDWIQNINKGLKSISAHAPGINFTQYSDANNKTCSYETFRIKFCKTDKHSVYTQGNIYDEKVCLIFLSNKWTNQRFWTAMHETLHTIGFKHEHCRKDRDEYVDVYSSNCWYEIEKDSKALTAFDPFSILFFGEKEGIMMRASNTGIFKLK